ncbi:unnamed protein product [Vitrella brassicaformis CCMP3155]|uniref:Metallo-beta-lactamase domain-containing protein n=1 Tax=Vitrella brassicaformis (strain CCMP3155) TaxID=1169540 RepID=A0A0G4FEU7_VITBC|nr:unnamed protein product [Vitrella brassicaformis CCMP3155]|eukprot:CEM11337.1 unnamed protein product [Vitrella brassicaformis CCMP3155]
MLGSGPSTGVPWLRCLTDPMDGRPCRVCREARRNSLSKNRRRNPSILLKIRKKAHEIEKENRDTANGGEGPDAFHIILIDCGKSFRDAVETFFPLLAVKRIDGVVLTHDHADAVLGIDDLRDLQRCEKRVDPVTGHSNLASTNALPIWGSSQTVERLFNMYPYLFAPDQRSLVRRHSPSVSSPQAHNPSNPREARLEAIQEANGSAPHATHNGALSSPSSHIPPVSSSPDFKRLVENNGAANTVKESLPASSPPTPPRTPLPEGLGLGPLPARRRPVGPARYHHHPHPFVPHRSTSDYVHPSKTAGDSYACHRSMSLSINFFIPSQPLLFDDPPSPSALSTKTTMAAIPASAQNVRPQKNRWADDKPVKKVQRDHKAGLKPPVNGPMRTASADVPGTGSTYDPSSTLQDRRGSPNLRITIKEPTTKSASLTPKPIDSPVESVPSLPMTPSDSSPQLAASTSLESNDHDINTPLSGKSEGRAMRMEERRDEGGMGSGVGGAGEVKRKAVPTRFTASIDWQFFEPLEKFKIMPLPVWHGKDYICYGFEFGEKERFVYLSDVSAVPEATMAYLKGGPRIATLVLDALFKDKTHPTHFSLVQACDLIRQLRPKQTFLTGMCHDFDYPHDNPTIKATMKSEGLHVEMGFDGLCIPLS